MGFWKKLFGASQPTLRPAASPVTSPGPSTTHLPTPASDRLTFDKAEDFSAVLEYHSAKKSQGKQWPSPTLIRQLRQVLQEAPVRNAPPSPFTITRQLPAIWLNWPTP
jgi:hypothetical protein